MSDHKRLYNGIELPAEWPPRSMDPASEAPMPVPYLDEPPAIIPIDIGRQLFVDDFLIESTDLTRTHHRPERYAGNPVMQAVAPDEVKGRGVCYLGHGGLFWDERVERFVMFYTAGWRGGLALAYSKDGVHWERPNHGRVRDNLVLAPGEEAGKDNCVWLDERAANPDERVKLMVDRGNHFTLHTSPDGLTWSEGIRTTGWRGDYSSFFHNPFRDIWAFSIKGKSPRGRSRYYYEHASFLGGWDWEDAVFWLNADPADDEAIPGANPQKQLYSLNAVAYESLMLGVFYIHSGPENKVCEEGDFPKLTDLTIGFSRDGFHWHRPVRTPFLAATRTDGSWERGYLHSTAGVCLVVGDKLYFPYTGYSGIAPDGTRDMYAGASVGFATLRRDGFASMDAGERGGTLTTRSVIFSGSHLFLNAAASAGTISVEIVGDDGVSMRAEATRFDSTCHRVTWQGDGDPARFAGRPVRLRFHVQNASLYAFWMSKDESGASRGYVAAGGPGYKDRRDTVGKAAYEAAQSFALPN